MTHEIVCYHCDGIVDSSPVFVYQSGGTRVFHALCLQPKTVADFAPHIPSESDAKASDYVAE